MRPGVTPHHISPLLPFHHGVTDYDVGGFSGVSRDGKFLWLVRGPVIEVLDSTSRRRLAAWAFGVTIKDTHSYITCVKEYCYGNSPKLLVGVCNAQQTSMLGVLDLQSSRLSKVIEIPHKINSVEVVTNVGGDFIPMWALNDQLRLFDGIIAVGTISGIVYLIDMCMDENIHSDEVMPSKLQYITPRSRDTADRRRQAIAKRNHLCLVLDEESHGNLFKYRRCDGTELKSFNPSDVIVTCLKYIPQIGTLVIGFSFGSYQLWKLNVPVLEYSSRVEEDSGSVLHVAYQEPENDPKNFCYLWIIRGCDTEDEETISSAALYQLAYNKKTWYSNYGAFYEELTSVSLRFDLEMTANLFNGASNTTVSSRAITGYTLEDPNYKPPAKLQEEESFEESVHGPDLSRCLFVWESTESSQKTYQMAVFDMNRWYHAQMPATLRGVGGNLATCSYLSIHSLDEAVGNSAHDELLAVHILTNSLSKFINTSPLPPEQHFYPASLAFDALLIMESGLIKCQFLGTQRQVLASMEKIGPSVLLNCKEQYNLCILMGLLPRPLDVSSHNPTTAQMREQLLTMALEYNMLPFLNRCIQDWSPGAVRLNAYAIDNQNQYSRRENLRIAGINEEEGEDLFSVLVTICDAMNLKLNKSDIVSCHRVGKKGIQNNNRTVILRTTRDFKAKIFANKKGLHVKEGNSSNRVSSQVIVTAHSSFVNSDNGVHVNSVKEGNSSNRVSSQVIVTAHSSFVNSDNGENSIDTSVQNTKSESVKSNSCDSVKVLALNVCDLKSKLKSPELEVLCNNYDILCFSESKLDQYDVINIKHFKSLPPLNRKNAKRKSGGIIVFVRDYLFENVEVLNSSNENVLWFILDNNVFDYATLFGAVYIPPESSNYSNIDIFDVLERDIIKYTAETRCKVCLLGDFNAHTGTKTDFTEINDYVLNSVQLEDVINSVNLETLGIDVSRNSLDLSVNNYGNRLLQLCQNIELLIVNGRLGKDKGIGAFNL
ncbi:Hypothetical predicted protein [Mytilus galloprovincialis]|nr:Hypothetical predicted protein [Mytilus galloprovincialis]